MPFRSRKQSPERPLFTKEEIATHSLPTDLWMVIHGSVYDVTPFVQSHPGGPEVLFEYGGQDATEAFDEVGHSQDSIDMLTPLCKGMIVTEGEKDQYYLDENNQLKKYGAENVSVGESRYWRETMKKRNKRIKDRYLVMILGAVAVLAALGYLYLIQKKWDTWL